MCIYSLLGSVRKEISNFITVCTKYKFIIYMYVNIYCYMYLFIVCWEIFVKSQQFYNCMYDIQILNLYVREHLLLYVLIYCLLGNFRKKSAIL
jgi:hypothetical protein